MERIPASSIGLHLLRMSLAFVFLWFSFSQISNVGAWTGFVPEWAVSVSGMTAGTLVLINAVFELIAGALLACNFFPRIVAALLGAHLFLIAASMGFSAIGVRDFGLALSAISFALLSKQS